MTAGEFRNWIRFFASRPFPDEAIDMMNGLLCSIVANLARGPTTPAYKPSDFFILKPAKVQGEVGSEADKFARR